VTTESDQGPAPKPAIRVSTDSGTPDQKAAIEVTTGFLLEKTRSAQDAEPSLSTCEPYRELIELELGHGRNAMGIWQDLVDRHGFPGGYQSVKRYVRQLRGEFSARVRRMSVRERIGSRA
jgi:hypothetical protein